MPEQLKMKATTDIDLQATDDTITAENIKATTDIDLQATDDARTAENIKATTDNRLNLIECQSNVFLLSIITFEPCEIEI